MLVQHLVGGKKVLGTDNPTKVKERVRQGMKVFEKFRPRLERERIGTCVAINTATEEILISPVIDSPFFLMTELENRYATKGPEPFLMVQLLQDRHGRMYGRPMHFLFEELWEWNRKSQH